jgi:transposase
MQQMRLAETINQQMGRANSQSLIDPGTTVAVMIHNILGNEPVRLYRLGHFFADKPLPLLFPWQPGLSLAALNDDRAGRALDELWRAGPQKVFSAVSQQILALYGLDASVLHLDSTSKSFYGAYEHQGEQAVPQLTHGYSKEHRPDLVQLLFGVGTTRDGVVVYGDVASGNTQDMVANGTWITQVRQQLGLEAQPFLLYVADSAVVTEDNLKALRLRHQELISRLPARYSLHEELLALAPDEPEQWTDLGALGQGKAATRYQVWETEADLAGATYRFLVLRSDSLAQQHRRTWERRVTKEWARLEKGLAQVDRQRFESESQAEAHWAAFLAQHKRVYHQVGATIEAVEVELPYPQRGRPASGRSRPTARRYRLVVTVAADPAAYRAARRKEGKFVLITSLSHPQAYPARSILAEYKEQHTAERAFRFLKDPTWVGAFCLKKPERIVALAYILLMAAMVYTLLERQVRQRLQAPEERPLLGLNNQPTKQPTAYAIKTILTPILVIAVLGDGNWLFRPAQPLSENQKRVLLLAGPGEDAYQWQGELNPGNYHSASP